MKILVKDLLPNPHRRVGEYPFNEEKINKLAHSMNETFIWKNLIARRSPTKKDKYELAYGHHRWMALKKLKVKEIEISVEKIDDATMLKVMADENGDDFHMTPAVLFETIKSVKLYLDKQIKGKGWDDLDSATTRLFATPSKFAVVQKNDIGVGESAIKVFLGDNWSGNQIKEALATLRATGELPEVDTRFVSKNQPRTPVKKQQVDKKSVRKLPTTMASTAFRKGVAAHKIPKERQRELADELSKKGASSKEVTNRIRKEVRTPQSKKSKNPDVERLEKLLLLIEENSKYLTNRMAEFNAIATELKVEEISGLKAIFNVAAVSGLGRQMRTYLKFFGQERQLSK